MSGNCTYFFFYFLFLKSIPSNISKNDSIVSLKNSIENIRSLYLASTTGRGITGTVGTMRNSEWGSLSHVSLTDKQRDDFDYQTKLIIQQTMTSIRQLEEFEQRRLKNEKEARGKLSSSVLTKFIFNNIGDSNPLNKEEQISNTLALHRAGILWYLNQTLKEVSARHASQQEIRLSRQLAKTKNTLHFVDESSGMRPFGNSKLHSQSNKTSSTIFPATSSSSNESAFLKSQNTSLPSSAPSSTKAADSSAGSNFDLVTNDNSYSDLPDSLKDLTPQQIIELEQENTALMDELELTLSKAKAAEKSLQEISQLQSTLAAHLSTQNDNIQSLLNDSSQVHQDILQANKQLDNAKERNRKASKIIIIVSLILAFILLFYDAMLW